MDGNYFGTDGMSNCLDLVTAEDLQPATSGYHFDVMGSQWTMGVIGSEGYPRKYLGTFVIRATWDGQLVTTVEE